MTTIHYLPTWEEREQILKWSIINAKPESRIMNINEFLSSLDSLILPAPVRNEAVNIFSKLKWLPSIEKLSWRIFLQDLIAYGCATTEPALDFEISNPKLAITIKGFNSDIQRSIYHILWPYVADNSLIDALKSTKHLLWKVLNLN